MLKVPHCRPATDPRFSKVTLEYSLGLNLVYTNFGVLILVMRDSEIVAVQFRDQNARLCAEASWNLRQQSVMVGILLFENIQSPVAGQIKALMLGVVTHVINHAYCRHIADHFTAVRVKDNQLTRISGDYKQTVVHFIKSHRKITFVARRQTTIGQQCRLVPVEDSNRTLTRQVAKHPWSKLFEHDRFDMVGVDFDIA